MHDTIDSYSIEEREAFNGAGAFYVYGWGEYGEYSVLAGQTLKKFMGCYDTIEEAKADYPDADGPYGFRSAHNTFNHLPGEDDPVPGGMYPDDI